MYINRHIHISLSLSIYIYIYIYIHISCVYMYVEWSCLLLPARTVAIDRELKPRAPPSPMSSPFVSSSTVFG